MSPLLDPIEAIRAHLARWQVPYVDLDTFGTGDPARIAALVDGFAREWLGSGVAGYLFCTASQGATHGIVLEDGRRLVLKMHQPPELNTDRFHDTRALSSVRRALAFLHERGFPSPAPVLGPTPLGKGLATVQEYLDTGEKGDGFDPDCRRVIARGLRELIDLLMPLRDQLSGLRAFFQPRDRLYPQPHSRLFDFERSARSAGWIDEIARRARAGSIHTGPPVFGHADWRIEHLRFEHGRISASYDWESLQPMPETQLVGVTAAAFTTDWSTGAGGKVPTVEDVRAFVCDYEEARALAFDASERTAIFATCVYTVAYGARCQHSLEPERRDWPPGSWPCLLRDADALLSGSPTLSP